MFHFFPNSKLNNPQRKIVYILLGQDTELLTKIHDSIFKYNGFGMNFVNMNVYSNDSTENSLEQHSSELYDGAIYAYSKPHFN
ncbi:hypothetical protein FACS1894166_08100 [Bacilli bacterium]|nr:hypothetical protein FACS1894166_08100 [Bacilli bacterium]